MKGNRQLQRENVAAYEDEQRQAPKMCTYLQIKGRLIIIGLEFNP